MIKLAFILWSYTTHFQMHMQSVPCILISQHPLLSPDPLVMSSNGWKLRRANNVVHLTVSISLPGCSSDLLESVGAHSQSGVQTRPQRAPKTSRQGSCRNAFPNAMGFFAKMGRSGIAAVNAMFEKIIFLVTLMKEQHTGKQTARRNFIL